MTRSLLGRGRRDGGVGVRRRGKWKTDANDIRLGETVRGCLVQYSTARDFADDDAFSHRKSSARAAGLAQADQIAIAISDLRDD